MILLEDDFVTFDENFQHVLHANVHRATKLDGQDDPTKARGFSNALTAMVDEIIRRYQGHKVRLAVVHGAAYDDAVKLRDRLMERLDVVSSFISPVSPALAIHTGPGLLGAIVQLAE